MTRLRFVCHSEAQADDIEAWCRENGREFKRSEPTVLEFDVRVTPAGVEAWARAMKLPISGSY